MMTFLSVTDSDNNRALIAADNISHIVRNEGMTRIYLRQVACHVPGVLWYVLTRETVDDLMARMADSRMYAHKP